MAVVILDKTQKVRFIYGPTCGHQVLLLKVIALEIEKQWVMASNGIQHFCIVFFYLLEVMLMKVLAIYM